MVRKSAICAEDCRAEIAGMDQRKRLAQPAALRVRHQRQGQRTIVLVLWTLTLGMEQKLSLGRPKRKTAGACAGA